MEYEATPETALTQVLAAFGYGLGGLYISYDAAKAGLSRFRPVVEKNIAIWDANMPAAVSYAAHIGRVTAHVTLTRGSNTVSARDLLEALRLIENLKEPTLGPCPFFHHHH
jgi:hypothetical protein